jgi:heme/copper-type cytochrome/quinol oxidase subunit 2
LQVEGKRISALGTASLVVALAQSLCTAVLTISGIRVAIGLSALAAASGIYAPARGFHQDAIRIPMLILATVGAVVNLAVLAWIRHLRARPSAQWRRRETSAKEKRSERLQVVLAIVTLILVGLETWTHPMVHRMGRPPVHSSSSTQVIHGERETGGLSSPHPPWRIEPRNGWAPRSVHG